MEDDSFREGERGVCVEIGIGEESSGWADWIRMVMVMGMVMGMVMVMGSEDGDGESCILF